MGMVEPGRQFHKMFAGNNAGYPALYLLYINYSTKSLFFVIKSIYFITYNKSSKKAVVAFSGLSAARDLLMIKPAWEKVYLLELKLLEYKVIFWQF